MFRSRNETIKSYNLNLFGLNTIYRNSAEKHRNTISVLDNLKKLKNKGETSRPSSTTNHVLNEGGCRTNDKPFRFPKCESSLCNMDDY